MLKKIQTPILITGARGFIGSNLLRFFISKDIRVNIIFYKTTLNFLIHKTKYKTA